MIINTQNHDFSKSDDDSSTQIIFNMLVTLFGSCNFECIWFLPISKINGQRYFRVLKINTFFINFYQT